MICPYCDRKGTGSGRVNEFDLSDLFDHILDRHPAQLLQAARGLMKDQAIELTDVEFQEGSNGA